MYLAVIDCETTGLTPNEAEVVEVAVVTLQPDGQILDTWSSLVKPVGFIPPVARAIHHISDADVADAPCLAQALLQASLMEGGNGRHTMAAHNAPFDSGFLGMEIQICTWRCAHHVWPDAPSFKNQVLRYWLSGLDEEILAMARERDNPTLVSNPHRALPDAWVTAHILRRLLRERTVEELVQLSTTPILHKTVGFGKYFGTPWAEVPKDYLWWIIRQGTFDEDTTHTARYHTSS